MTSTRYLNRSVFLDKQPLFIERDAYVNLYDYIKHCLADCVPGGTLEQEPEDLYIPLNMFVNQSGNKLPNDLFYIDLQEAVGRVLTIEYNCIIANRLSRSWTDSELKKWYISKSISLKETTASRISGIEIEGDDRLTDGKFSYFIPNEAINLKELVCIYSTNLGCSAFTPDFDLTAQNNSLQISIDNINLTSLCGGLYTFNVDVTDQSGGPVLYSNLFDQSTLVNPIPYSTFGLGPGSYTLTATLEEAPCLSGNNRTKSVNFAIPVLATANNDTYNVSYNAASSIYDIGANDVPCTFGTTSWVEISPLSPAGPTSNLNPVTGEITFQPNIGNAGTFITEVAIACDGTLSNTSIITFDVASPTAQVFTLIFSPALEGSTVPISASGSAITCSTGTTTFALIPGTNTNCTGVVTDALVGDFDITGNPGFTGTSQIQYGIYCDGILIDTAFIRIEFIASQANAVDDILPDQVRNSVVIGDVSTNDIACSLSATTTYQVVPSSVSNGNVIVNSNGTFTFIPSTDFTGNVDFEVELLCDGVVVDSSSVSWNYVDNDPFLSDLGSGTGVVPGYVNTSGTLGNFVAVRLDKNNNTIIDYDSTFVTNTGSVIIETVGFDLTDGDRIQICAATDALGANANCGECIIPDSLGAFTPTTGQDDLNDISIDITGTWGVVLPFYTYQIEYIDSSSNIVFTEVVNSPSPAFTHTVNLINEGVTDFSEFRVKAFSVSCAEQDIITIDRCGSVNHPAISDNLIQSYLNNGNSTHTYNLEDLTILFPFINKITGTTSLSVDSTGSSGDFIRCRILRNGINVFNSSYGSNNGSAVFDTSAILVQNGDVVAIDVSNVVSGANASTYTWELPLTTDVIILNPVADSFSYRVTSEYDIKSTIQELEIEYYDISNVLGYSETISYTGGAINIDLTAQGMASIGSLRVRSKDNKSQEPTQFLKQVNACANTDELDDLLLDYTPAQAADFLSARYGQDVFQEPPAATYAALIGGAGTTFRDPTFGTKIKVITTTGVSQINSERNHWNSDQSLAFIKRNSTYVHIIDGQNGDLLYQRDVRYQGIDPRDGIRWHPTLPNVLYYPIGNQLIFYNVVTQNQYVGFTSPNGTIGTGNRRIAGGDGNDDVGTYLLLSHGDKNTGLQVLNMATGNIVYDELIGSPGSYQWVKSEEPWTVGATKWNHPVSGQDFDYATLSADGQYIITQVDGLGTEIYDFNGNKLGQVAPTANHMSQGLYDLGNGLIKTCVTGKTTPGAVSTITGSSTGDLYAALFNVDVNSGTGIRSLQVEYRILVDHTGPCNQCMGGQYSQGSSNYNMLMAQGGWQDHSGSITSAYYGEIIESSLRDDDPVPRRLLHSMSDQVSPVSRQAEAWLRPDGKAMIYKSTINQQFSNNGYLFWVDIPERTCIANR
jgi:hypothetical protein